MDGLKELVDAFSSRVRSPVFGSIVIAFLLWNWQAVFLLVFGGGDAPERLGTFTGSLGLAEYGIPVALGLIYLIVGPWLNLGAAIAVARPVNMRRDLVDKWAVERAQKRAVLAAGLADAATIEAEAELKQRTAEAEVEAEKRRAELEDREAEIRKQEADAQLAQQKREAELAKREEEAAEARRKEQEILDRAQKDLEASKIENEELRAQVQGQLDAGRSADLELLNGYKSNALAKDFDLHHMSLILSAFRDKNHTLNWKYDAKGQGYLAPDTKMALSSYEFDQARQELVDMGIFKQISKNDKNLRLTAKGVELAERL